MIWYANTIENDLVYIYCFDILAMKEWVFFSIIIIIIINYIFWFFVIYFYVWLYRLSI